MKGVQATTMEGLTEALAKAIKDQIQNHQTTFIEVILNQELGEPFRRDAMKKPVRVAGIHKEDMRPQLAI
jgi:sulfoacetaldehyde acetyltransferase